MKPTGRSAFTSIAVLATVAAVCGAAWAQEKQYPRPTQLPNPYRLVAGWPSLPKNMNGGHWGEVIRVSVDSKGNIYTGEVDTGKRAQKFILKNGDGKARFHPHE